MAEFPALPLFTDAYLGDTTHLTTFEHGAYLLLLMIAWRSSGCCLPDNDALLARYSKTTLDKWRKLRPIIQPFFSIRDGFWHQARLQDEFRLLQSRRDQQREAGLCSAAAKSMKRQTRCSTTVGAPLQRSVNETSTPTPTPIEEGSVANATGASADPIKDLFDAGVALLIDAGHTDKQARSLIGKWRKRKSDGGILQGLLDCR